MVAVSVSAKEVQAVGGALKPGFSVDIYSAGASGVTLIAQGVNVLATSAFDGSGTGSGAALSWVALAVKPSAVAEIIAAEERTELYFVLPGQDASSASAASGAADSGSAGAALGGSGRDPEPASGETTRARSTNVAGEKKVASDGHE